MDDQRQKPEQILARIKSEEEASKKGKLKIFLGAAPGVGKTYTMLEAAQELLGEGVDVVGGVVVTHGRKDTEELIEGLEILPPKSIVYKTGQVDEFDIDLALKRNPSAILIDELAHTNVPGSRHEKRWQDVVELLQSGINVLTTVNIQHLESANDLVAQITGIKVSETVPDFVFEKANEVELVDLPPDDLIQRLKEGKVYLPENAATALENFFRKGNLIALRELALRVTAEHVDAEMLKYRETSAIQDVWPVGDRLLVCISPSPLSARLVRATKRMAGSLKAEWIAAYVDAPGQAVTTEKHQRAIKTLQMAERLGAQTTQLSGTNFAEELVKYAQQRNVSKIIIGKPARPRWKEIIFGSVVDDLIRRSGNIDVYVITGEKRKPESQPELVFVTHSKAQDYLISLLFIGVATALAFLLFRHLAPINIAMIYQLAIVIVALSLGRGPSALAALTGVAAFDFFFVPPYFTFAVTDSQYLITFAVMLIVGLALSTLTSTVQQQVFRARERERQTASLYAMTREQASAISTKHIVDVSLKHICEITKGRIVAFLTTRDNQLNEVKTALPSFEVDSNEFGVAQWVFLNQQPAGATTNTLSGSRALYVPLIGTKRVVGVIGIIPSPEDRLSDPAEKHFFETFVNQTALAVERAQLSEGSNVG